MLLFCKRSLEITLKKILPGAKRLKSSLDKIICIIFSFSIKRWALCWPHEPCHQGGCSGDDDAHASRYKSYQRIRPFHFLGVPFTTWNHRPHSRQVTGARCTEVAARQSWAYSLGMVSRYSTVRSGTLTWREWGLCLKSLPSASRECDTLAFKTDIASETTTIFR